MPTPRTISYIIQTSLMRNRINRLEMGTNPAERSLRKFNNNYRKTRSPSTS